MYYREAVRAVCVCVLGGHRQTEWVCEREYETEHNAERGGLFNGWTERHFALSLSNSVSSHV